MPIQTTMTGSWFRSPEILELVRPDSCPTGEISEEHASQVYAAEKEAVRAQVQQGLTWVSNGEQRKAGYTYYLPNRFTGFSTKERASMQPQPTLIQEFLESNAALAHLMSEVGSFSLPKIESKLVYNGEKQARKEAEDAKRLAGEEGAKRIFVCTTSPGVVTVFFPKGDAYSTHYDYLFDVARELRKEYQALLAVDGVDIQLDAPDLAMGKQTATWGVDFYEAIHQHVDAINEAVAGLPTDRIRVHYCYGNWSGSHRFDAEFKRILPELLRLKAGTLVGEMANPRHEGDALVLRDYLREHEWPSGLKLAAGVIDVKTPIVETPDTVAMRLGFLASLDKLGPDRLLGGTDCGFETFAGMGNVPKVVGIQKLKSLSEGAAQASQ